MAMDALQDTDMDLVAKADKIARGFCQRVPDSHVFIKLANTDQLIPFGFAGPAEFDVGQSLCGMVDDVCMTTMADNAPVRFNRPLDQNPENASEAQEAPPKPDVAIMALPIRDKHGQAIGAICALSQKADHWSDFDQLAFELACCQTQNLLATTALNSQLTTLSQALKEYDDIATMIATHAHQTFSVHGPSGELIFATNALLQQVKIDELEAQIRKKGNMAAVSIQPESMPEMAHATPAGDFETDEMDLAIAPDKVASDKQVWRARVQNDSKYVTFVHWELDPA